jgi:hypothetical protein
MAQVDPADDSIKRFIVRHYRYDPERRERRHVVVAAFDNEPEYQVRAPRERSTSPVICAERRTGTCCGVRSAMGFPTGARRPGAALQHVIRDGSARLAPGLAGLEGVGCGLDLAWYAYQPTLARTLKQELASCQ